MLLSVLISCTPVGEDDTKDTIQVDTTATEVTDDISGITTYLEQLDPSISDIDYRGERTITILSRDLSVGSNYAGRELTVEELTNNPVDDAIYYRNAAVCETLGLSGITEVEVEAIEELQQKVGLMIGADDHTYDIVAASVVYGSPMINQGYMLNLYDNGIDTYLDTSKPWWSQHWLEQAEMGDRLYCITGAPALTLTRLLFAFYYNKDLGENLGLEDMYTVVDEGRWTVDYLAETVAEVYNDENGDSLKDEEDRYGLAINHYEHCDMFWSCFDMTMLSKNEEGWFELDNSGKEKLSIAFDKVFALIRENPGTFDTIDTLGFDLARDMFSGGNILYAPLHLSYAESSQFRNMQDEYGILPSPKFDKAQDDYYTYAHDQYTIFMIPKSVEDPELSGAVLETMAYESYKSLQPTYYNTILKGRYANDPQSRKMLDIITTNVKIDAAWIYGRQLGQPAANVFRGPIYGGEKTFASKYERVSKTLPLMLKEMKRVISAFDF